MILNVRHTGIVVRDLDRMAMFYQQLGFVSASDDVEQGKFIEQVVGIDAVRLKWVKLKSPDGYLLELLQYLSHPKKSEIVKAESNQLGCSHIAVTVDDIAFTCKEIIGFGGTILNPPALSTNGKVKVAYCHDPEGVLIELVEEL
jgi:catechol 2,3-dioxygenase-like lactoylglutathione lyase family enzyme